MAKSKKVKTAFSASPLPQKTPRVEAHIEFYKLRPAWRISLLEMCDPFGWHALDKHTLNEIRRKLAEFETRTWNDILLVSKKQNHSISVNDLSAEAKKRLKDLELDDIDEVVSLKLSGKERVFGIRHDVALTLLWWDPHHKVCPSILKHT